MYTHTQAHVVQTQDEGFKIVGEFLLTGLCAYQRATIFTTATFYFTGYCTLCGCLVTALRKSDVTLSFARYEES